MGMAPCIRYEIVLRDPVQIEAARQICQTPDPPPAVVVKMPDRQHAFFNVWNNDGFRCKNT